MKLLRFYGSSDDTFGYELGTTGTGDDHDDCATGKLMMFRVQSVDDGLIVVGRYSAKPGNAGTWMVGISQLAEDMSLPEWPMRWEVADLGYSVMLVIEAPDDVVITDLWLEDADAS
jgi:hypothetical protein